MTGIETPVTEDKKLREERGKVSVTHRAARPSLVLTGKARTYSDRTEPCPVTSRHQSHHKINAPYEESDSLRVSW